MKLNGTKYVIFNVELVKKHYGTKHHVKGVVLLKKIKMQT